MTFIFLLLLMWKMSSSGPVTNWCPELGKQMVFEISNINHVSPECWENVQPKFTLRMRNKKCIIADDSSQLFEQNQCSVAELEHLVIIVHGFDGSGKNDWIDSMWPEIFHADERPNLGILIVDWSKGADFDWKSWIPSKKHLFKKGPTGPYLQAAANTRYVGAATEKIISQMDPSVTIHCIGHSLGAHVCGFLGQAIKEDTNYSKSILERITGMDPAGPHFFHNFFHNYDNVSLNWRLDKTDAEKVDIIHTDGNFLGTMVKHGRTDFYAGGSPSTYGNTQACCWHSICDHSRAHLLLLESLKQHNMDLPVAQCTKVSAKTLSGCHDLINPPNIGYFYNGSHPGIHGVIFHSGEVSKTVTEEDCLGKLSIVTGVTTACSKVGRFLCPFSFGIGCIVSTICESFQEGVLVVTGARSACQACAQGKGSYDALHLLHDGQQNILKQVQKVNNGIENIHTKLETMTEQLDRLEIMVVYADTMQNYLNIKRLFNYIKKDQKTGLVVPNRDLDNFLTSAMDSDSGLDRTLFELFDMMNGVKRNPFLYQSIFQKVPESCETVYFEYLWSIITDCIFMEEVAFSTKGTETNQIRVDEIRQNLVDISDQYVEYCGCHRLGLNYVPARHNLARLENFKFDISCGNSMASTCSACPEGKEYCAGDCTWHEGGCQVKIRKIRKVRKVRKTTRVWDKLIALYNIRPFSLASSPALNFAKDIPMETIQLLQQFQKEERAGGNVSLYQYNGKQFCTEHSHHWKQSISKVDIKTGFIFEAETYDYVSMEICDQSGNCCATILPNKLGLRSGNIDQFSGSTYPGSCLNTAMDGNLTVNLEKYGSDRWFVDWVQILLKNGNFFTCPFHLWIDNDPGYLNSNSVQCTEVGCPHGWHKHNTQCYRLYTTRLSWSDSRDACLAVDATLAAVKDEATNKFILNLDDDVYRFWLGGHQSSSGDWSWPDGSGILQGYNNWYPGQPDGSGQACLYMIGLGNMVIGGYWGDWPCDWTENYVCAKHV